MKTYTKEREMFMLDLAKIICMLLVVLGHACVLYTGTKWGGMYAERDSNLGKNINLIVSTFHTQTFTAASGYLYFYLKNEKKKYCNLKMDIAKRAHRLLLPYVIVSVIWAIPFGLVFEKLSMRSIFRNYVLMISPAQLWFLPMLFGVWVFFRVFWKWVIRIPNSVMLVLLFLVFFLSDFLSGIIPIAIFQIKNIAKYLLFFYIGIRLSSSKKELFISLKFRLGVYIIEVVALRVYFFVSLSGYLFVLKLIQPFISILGILCVFSLAFSLSEKINRCSSFYDLLISNSMGIFLLHQQIMYVFIRCFNKQYINPIITILMCFGGTTIVSLILSSVLRNNGYCCVGRVNGVRNSVNFLKKVP